MKDGGQRMKKQAGGALTLALALFLLLAGCGKKEDEVEGVAKRTTSTVTVATTEAPSTEAPTTEAEYEVSIVPDQDSADAKIFISMGKIDDPTPASTITIKDIKLVEVDE